MQPASGGLAVCLEDSVLASVMLTCSHDKMELNYPASCKAGSSQPAVDGLFYN